MMSLSAPVSTFLASSPPELPLFCRKPTNNRPPAPEASSHFLPHSLPPPTDLRSSKPALQVFPPLVSTAVPSLLAWQHRLRRHRRGASPAAAIVALFHSNVRFKGHHSVALASSVEAVVCDGASSV